MSTHRPTALPRRNRLLSSCAVAVIATLTVHMPVRAQATINTDRGFQGSGSFVGGGGVISPGGLDSKTTTIFIDAPRTIINWSPTDTEGTGSINFLPDGHSANFANRETGNFIVLNRILPANNNRAIELNGTITSRVNGSIGGDVWFYSPGGILVGGTATINVGSLLLSAADVANEDFLDGNDSFQFGAVNPSAAVEVQGNISAVSRNSYVALIAPRVVQSGNVTVNGSAAYVAAEAAMMTISGSLFDIEVTQGSGFGGSGNGDAALVHEGTTTIRNEEVGYGETGYGASPTTRTAIMVAVPKNDAVTMLVQGNIAYQQATNVEQVNGRIILSGGNDVRLDPFSETHDFQANAATGKADILISNAEGRSRFDTDVDAQATGVAKATAIARNQSETGYGGQVTPLDDLSFGGRLDLEGFGGATLEALAGSRIDVAGTLDLDASGTDIASTAKASLIARAGSDIDVGSRATIEADLSASGASGDAANLRTAEVIAEGGRIHFAGQATVSAGAGAAGRSSSGMNIEGGIAKVSATAGGEIRLGSLLTVDASAIGAGCCSGLGGDAKGGTASVEAGAGSLIRSVGGIEIYATGAGGFGGEGGVGAGTGGVASILASGGVIEVGNTLLLDANGFGGVSFDGDVGYGLGKGGDAILGISTIGTNIGRISVDHIAMEATGSAGFSGSEEALFLAAENGSGGGGDAEGGRVTATIDGVLAPFSVEGSTSMELRADAFGTRGTNGSGSPAQAGGDAVGGTISVEFRSGTTNLSSLSASAEGIGGDAGSNFGSGDGAAGGMGDAGAITIRATGGEVSIGDLSIDLTGRGGDGAEGGYGGNGGAGGVGRGGDLALAASGTGVLTVTTEEFAASGFGGQGGDGGSSSGGSGGDGGNGGAAFGGIIRVTATEGGTVNIRPNAIEDGYGNILGYEAPEFRALAEGGSGGDGGRGFGGEGSGGIGGNGGFGGAATGGRIEIDVTGGTLDFRPDVSDPVLTILRLLASGDGGQGGDGGFGDEDDGIAGNGGNGGFAKGGTTRISVTDGTLSVGQLQLVSAGHGGGGGIGGEAEEGGNGGRGGDAHGGGVTFSLAGATSFNQLSSGIELQAYGEAGHGGDGGTGVSVGGVSGAGGHGIGGGGTTEETGTITGGVAINLSADNVTIASITARAKGDGGIGGSGFVGVEGIGSEEGDSFVTAEGGTGGTGTGGAITLTSTQGTNTILSRIKFSANGEGGAGGSSQSLAGGNGGKGVGGGILIEATGTGELITQGATLNSYGLGGAGNNGGNARRGGNGGRGGDAVGGRVELATLQQGKITLTMGEGGGDLQANAYARAGAGGSGGDGSDVGDTGGRGGNGGDATAGIFAIDIAGGTITLGSVTGDANAQGGSAGSGGTGAGRPDDPITENVNEAVDPTPAPGGNGGNATGGTIRIDVRDGDGEAAGVLTAGSVNLFASGSGGSGDVAGTSSAGTIGIFESARAAVGSIRFGNLNAEAFGDNAAHAIGFELDTDTGRIDVDSSVNVDVSNDVRMIGRGSGTLMAGFEVDIDAGGSISLTQDTGATVPLIQADFVDLDAEGSILGASAGILAQESIDASGFNVSLGRLTTTNPEFGGEGSTGIRVDAFGEAFIGSADSATTVVVQAGGLTGGMLKAEDFVSVTVNSEAGATGSVDIDGAEAGEFVRIEASNDVAAGSLIAGGNVSVGTFGDVTVGTAEAGEDIRIDGGSITLASGTAGRDVLLNAFDAIDVTFAEAGDDFRAVSSNGTVTAENVITTGLGEDLSESGYGPGDGTNIILDAQDDARLNNATTPGAIRLNSSAGSILSAGTLRANSLTTMQGRNIALTDVIVTQSLSLLTNGGSISGRSFTSDGAINLDSAANIDLAAAQAGGSFISDSNGDGTYGTINGAALVDINAGRNLTIGTVTAGGVMELNAGLNTTVATASGANVVDINAGENTTIGTVSGVGLVDINAGDTLTITTVNSDGDVELNARFDTLIGTVTATGYADMNAGADISVGSATTGDHLLVNARFNGSVGTAEAGARAEFSTGSGDLTLGTVEAGGFVEIFAGSAIDAGSIEAASFVQFSSGSNATIDSILAGDFISGSTGGQDAGDLTIGDADAGGAIDLFAFGDIDVGTASAVGDIFAQAQGISFGSATATPSPFGGEGGGNGNIIVFGNGPISIGSGDAAGFIEVSGTEFAGGDLKAGEFVRVQVGGEGGGNGTIELASAEAGDFIGLFGTGAVDAGTLAAGSDIAITGSAITLADGTAARDILLETPGAIDVGTALAGDDFVANGASFTGGTVVTTSLGEDTTETGYGPGAGDGSNILVDAAGSIRLDNGSAPDLISLTARNGRIDGAGLIQTTQFDASGTSDIALTDVDVINGLFLSASAGSVSGRNFASEGDIDLSASNAIAVASANAGGRITLQADDVDVGAATAVQSIFASGGTVRLGSAVTTDGLGGEGSSGITVQATGDVTIGSTDSATFVSVDGANIEGGALKAAQDVTLTGSGNVTVQEARAGDDISIMAGGTALVGAAMAPGTGTDSEGDGFNIDVEAVGNVSFGSADTVGNLRLVSQQGGILRLGAPEANLIEAGGNVFVSSAFDLNLSAVNAGGAISLASQGAIDTGSLAAGGDLSLDAGAALSVDAATADGELFAKGTSIEFGSVAIGGLLSLDTPGALVLGTANAGSISGSGSTVTAGTLTTPGSIALTATTGPVDVGTATAGSDIVLSGNGVMLTDGTAGRDIRLASAGDIGVGSAKAGDDFEADASGAFTGTTVITTGEGPDAEDGENGYGTVALAANDGSNITITATGAIALATGTAADTVDLTSSQASIASTGALTAGGSLLGTAATTIDLAQAKAGQAVDLEAGGNLTVARIEAGTGVTLASSGGAVLVSQDLKSGQPVDASGRSVTLNAQGALAVRSATASAGNVALTSAGNLQVERADATAQVSASSGNTLGLTGQVNGTQISLASREIAIGSNAQVGTTQRTTGIQITANGAGWPVVIGGSASGSGYRLDNAEFARLASRDVTISSQGESGSMQIDALTVRGAGASNPNVTGRLSFAAGGDVEMTGRLAFDTATEANSVRVSAGDEFFADAAGAGIAVTNGSALAGSVEIDARSIVIASRAAAGELGSINDIDDRSDRLGQNDGSTPDNSGFVRAGAIRLWASEKIHVQNSGINSDEPDDRAGLSAGAGGITLITNSSTTPVEIIINGRAANPAGGEFTGEALIDELTIVGANGGQANFAARSTVNGCLISGVNCGVIILPESPLTFAKDVIEAIEEEEEEEGEETSNQPPEVGFNRLIDMEGSPFVPVIDEPVTGSGNEDLSIGAFGGFTEEEVNRPGNVGQPVTGTGNEQLQSGPAPLIQLPPPQPSERPGDVSGPVTGTGNETLQSSPPRED